MGLLNGIFNKEELAALKQGLTEKQEEVNRLKEQFQIGERNLADLKEVKDLLESRVLELQSELRLGQQSEADLTTQLATARRLIDTSADNHRRAAAESDTAMESLKLQLSAISNELELQKRETESLGHENLVLRRVQSDRTREYEDREAKLDAKSQRLITERTQFQRQATDLQVREQRWHHTIEPQLKRWEEHEALEAKRRRLHAEEADLAALRRAIEAQAMDLEGRGASASKLASREAVVVEWEALLSGKEADIDARRRELDVVASELDGRGASEQELSRREAKIAVREALQSGREVDLRDSLARLAEQRAAQKKLEAELKSEEIALKRIRTRGEKLDLEKELLARRAAAIGKKEEKQAQAHEQRKQELAEERRQLRESRETLRKRASALQDREAAVADPESQIAAALERAESADKSFKKVLDSAKLSGHFSRPRW